MGRPSRELIAGEPHCYCVHATSALGHEIFAKGTEDGEFLDLVERMRYCLDLRIYAYLILPDSYYLILQHQGQVRDHDQVLQERWHELTGSKRILPATRLRQRFTSLTAIMQTLAQRYSRGYHQRNGGRGSIWGERYRACLLADDSAVLAAIAFLHSHQDQALRLAPLHGDELGPFISPSPLREVAAGVITPTDEAPLGTHPPAAETWPVLLADFLDGLDDDSRNDYGHALRHGWALGRPESLVPSLSRMSRSSGRGRSRQIHELNDDLGLCGLWG